MRYGNVFVWTADSSALGGHIDERIEALLRLCDEGEGDGRLWGRFARVRNGGAANELDPVTGAVLSVPIGDAVPGADGNFNYGRHRGGGRLDRVLVADPGLRERYIEASHFGEVNTYYHLDRMAAYVDGLLSELGAPGLPQVIGVVNAHHGGVEQPAEPDGLSARDPRLAFQGGHYRLPSRHFDMPEVEPLSPDGEIHLGPGRKLLEYGALVQATGGRYRANASHNAGIIYHEYGHHVTRHTADFRANAYRRPDRNDNHKTALDEGTCDYLTATLLGTPHIWAFHRRHDEVATHPRSLVSSMTMADFDHGPGADSHANGTIWAAALWDVRARLAAEPAGARAADLLALQTLLLIGRLTGAADPPTPASVSAVRASYSIGLSAFLRADELLNAGQNRGSILAAFGRRGIQPNPVLNWENTRPRPAARSNSQSPAPIENPSSPKHGGTSLRGVAMDHIPPDESLLSGKALEAWLKELKEPPLSFIAVGDTMLGERTKTIIAENGADYPLDAVRPLLSRARIVMGNLEGPFARHERAASRAYSYRVKPELASALSRGGINVVTLANNHLLDCGRTGVLETLDALHKAGIASVGGGKNEHEAHRSVVAQDGALRIGLLAYYWNRRTAATDRQPGSAMDSPERIAADIGRLREKADRVVVTFHWGVPYERAPSAEDRAKAHLAIECGADVVIGHHPHVIQPLEIYRGCPIFYSIGNFAFGTGNSRAEGLAIGFRFEDARTLIYVFPLYVKNRDPRVNYQPKVLTGSGARRVLGHLAELSGPDGSALAVETFRAKLELPYNRKRHPATSVHGDSL